MWTELSFQTGTLPDVLFPILFRMAVSFVCGALVGAEREWKGKPAGLRTNILICLGATLFTLCSEFSAFYLARAPQEAGRVTAQIVTGVGFLGAGAILRSGRGVAGLTTAATIWLVSAIGVMVGLGFLLVGVTTALLTVLTLLVLGRVEKRIMGPCEIRILQFHIPAGRPVELARAEAVLASAVWPTKVESFQKDEAGASIRVSYCIRHPSHRGILWDIGHREEEEA